MSGKSGSGARTRADGLIRAFAGLRVVVVGDMVADEYLVGRPWRMSREAPVLVLRHAERRVLPGGAANPAANLAALGAQVLPVGVIGDDALGRELREALTARGMSTEGLLIDPGRPTSTKTRVIGAGEQEVAQQIVRIDRVDDHLLEGPSLRGTIDFLRRQLPRADALLISDYENGVISPEVTDACLIAARAARVVITVDSHGDLYRFRGVTAATPNQPEAEATAGRRAGTRDELDGIGGELLAGMDARAVLVTRGSAGMALYERDRSPYHLPVADGEAGTVVDVTGAGDTVAATFTLALAVGADPREAAFLGNLAGGRVVRKAGTATITPAELTAGLESTALPWPVPSEERLKPSL